MTKTCDEIIGQLTREVAALKALIEAHNKPIKEQIKEKSKQIERLLLEDGRQEVNTDLFPA